MLEEKALSLKEEEILKRERLAFKANVKAELLKSNWKIRILILVLIVLLIISAVISISLGAIEIQYGDIVKIVALHGFGIEMGNAKELSSTFTYDIVWNIRMPRILAAICVGAALAAAGVVMQAVVKNPLADPYILGISSGASLGATLAVLFGFGLMFGNQSIGAMAFFGALGSATMVYLISSLGGRMTSIKLILSGMAISALCSAFSSFIVYMADDAEGMRTIAFWLMGSLAGAKWFDVFLISIVVFPVLLFFLLQFRHLNMLLLGDVTAKELGTELNVYRKIYLVAVALIVGLSVYVSGMIGFVGLIIPHIVRMVVGTDHKKLFPVAVLTGAIFLLWADVFARSVFEGRELPIGIVTSMIGAPVFIYLMVKRAYGFGKSSI